MNRSIVGALLSLATSVTSCGRSCEDVGCLDGLTIKLKRPVPATQALHLTVSQADSMRECIIIPGSNGCENAGISPMQTGEQWDEFYLPGLDWTNITVELYRDGSTEVQRFAVTYDVSQPNGASCPPTCESATIEF